MNQSSGNFAIVLASGNGTRFRSEVPKQFLKLAGKTVLEHTLDCFENHSRIGTVIVVCAAEHRLLVDELVVRGGYRKVRNIVEGGRNRQESSAAGIAAVTDDEAKVLVHDAVRPLLDSATIDRCLDALQECDAVDTGIPSSDTVIAVDEMRNIVDIPDRSTLRLGQTPQGFRVGLLRAAHRLASCDTDIKVTDDCGLILRYNLGKVRVVEGDVSNIKITYPSDIYLADRLFQLRTRHSSLASPDARLRGKVVVVFGGSRGIGSEIAAASNEAGALVRAVSRADDVDVGNAEAVRQVLAETWQAHGKIDLVVNTAGVLRTGILQGQSYSDIDEQLRTNLLGSIVVARESFDYMKGVGGSIALFTSSSYTRGRAGSSVYSATKAAIVNLVQALSQEYLPFGVRINAINPERTATPMRIENFGHEPHSELLSASTVANATLATMLSDATGEVVDVRR
jgi:2-C-methyl-D-erythritol 4-phosphate cytidylyltransferase